MSKIKLCYVVSKIDKAIAFEWIVENLKADFELEFVLLSNKLETPLASFLKNHDVNVTHYRLNGKLSLVLIFCKLFLKFLFSRPKVVHTHLFEASIIGLTAAKLAGVSNRVYTRHHSTYHHLYFQQAVKYDHFINKISTHIIAISNNVKRVLIDKEQVNPKKIYLIEHGFDLKQFYKVNEDRIELLRNKYEIEADKMIIGVIARYMEWKGVHFIVRGFCSILKKFPDAKLVIANASGPYKSEIQKELSKLPSSSYVEVEFENDLFALYQLFDVYVHTPIDAEIEAFGQTYVESLASSIPSVFTLSGIAKDFIINEKNALVVDYKSSEQIANAIIKLLEQKDLRESIKKNGLKTIQRFNLVDFCSKLKSIYKSK